MPQRGGAGGNFRFFQDTISELKKVVWPTRQQTINLSLIVIAASSGVGIALGVIDWVFTRVVDAFLQTGTPTNLPPIG